MSVSAVNSGLNGLIAAQSWFDTAARAASRVSAPEADDGAVVDGMVGMTVASTAAKVNIAVLRTALDNERSLIDVFA